MDGYEATKAIRQGDPSKSRIPIIALTANATQKDIEKCLAAGMNDCIAKPFTPEDLFRILVKYNPTRPVFPTAVPRLTSASHPGIDLSYLQRVSNNNQAFVNEMVQAFLQSIPRSIEEIDHAMQTENPQALARALHKIKPSLTMMGLGEIKEKVVTIEGLSKTTPAHEVHASVEHLLKSLREAFQALNSLSPR
jgi:CheY-like chemotaxis protein